MYNIVELNLKKRIERCIHAKPSIIFCQVTNLKKRIERSPLRHR